MKIVEQLENAKLVDEKEVLLRKELESSVLTAAQLLSLIENPVVARHLSLVRIIEWHLETAEFKRLDEIDQKKPMWKKAFRLFGGI